MTQPYTGRREDTRLVSGAGRYTSDWNLPGQAHAAFLRSDRAHARIVSLDVSAARAHPGVLAVLTGEDAREAKLIAPPSMMSLPGRDGQKLRNPPRYALAQEKVRYVGENIAMVVAESAMIAADAAELIAVEFEDLPAVVDVDDAMAAGASNVHEDVPGNVCFEIDYGDEAAVAQAFSGAARVVRAELDSQRLVGNPMEPRSCLAAWDAATDTYDFYSSSQGINFLRMTLATYSGVPGDRIRCHAQDVGGAFGIRFGAYAEYAASMLASRRLGRPVKWTGSRTETFLSDYHGRSLRMRGELALDANGGFLAIRTRFIVDQGAYPSEGGAISGFGNPRSGITGAYRIPLAYGLHRMVFTNTSPITAYRGAGRPDISYLVEQLVDRAAVESGIDRIELRRRNLIPADAFPYKTPIGVVYDSADFPGMLEEALRLSDWNGFSVRREKARARGRLLGAGCAVFIEPSGGAAPPKEQVAVRFDGEGVVIHSLSGASGQGHETVFPEVMSRILGIPAERITLRASDPAGPALIGGGSIGSRTSFMVGGAVQSGAREVIARGLALAADALEAAVQDVEFVEGNYVVKGTDRRIALLDLARRHAGTSPHPLDGTGETPASTTFPNGVHVAEIEIDPETGVAELTRYFGIDDCGRMLNETLLKGQIQGGIAQAAGQVFGEHGIYDRATGQMVTATFMDYVMPRADLFPEMVLVDRSRPSPANEIGAKGAGEAGTTAALAALGCALGDAMRQGGVSHFDFPASPVRVWEALRGARKAA